MLLGGAVALLPVYAREILHTGPWGLGLLRTAPGVGAAIMAVLLAHRPLRGRSGHTLLWSVAGFGIFTIIFGISRSLTISLIALLLLGASDMISVIIRATLTQLATPDEMRGRVTAVDMIFIGTSNEFGQFESGVTAQWFGTVTAVVSGRSWDAGRDCAVGLAVPGTAAGGGVNCDREREIAADAELQVPANGTWSVVLKSLDASEGGQTSS